MDKESDSGHTLVCHFISQSNRWLLSSDQDKWLIKWIKVKAKEKTHFLWLCSFYIIMFSFEMPLFIFSSFCIWFDLLSIMASNLNCFSSKVGHNVEQLNYSSELCSPSSCWHNECLWFFHSRSSKQSQSFVSVFFNLRYSFLAFWCDTCFVYNWFKRRTS